MLFAVTSLWQSSRVKETWALQDRECFSTKGFFGTDETFRVGSLSSEVRRAVEFEMLSCEGNLPPTQVKQAVWQYCERIVDMKYICLKSERFRTYIFEKTTLLWKSGFSAGFSSMLGSLATAIIVLYKRFQDLCRKLDILLLRRNGNWNIANLSDNSRNGMYT